QLEDQIEKLADERNVWKGVVKVAKEQRKYLRHLEKLPRTRTGGNTTGPREDWNAIYTLIGTRMTELSTTVREAKLKQRGINRQIKELKKKLKAIGGKSQNRTEMRVDVKASAPMETTLTLEYLVPSASWNAFYDAHLTTGDQTDGAARKLSLTRFASISQSSGEDWENIALSLSTTKPGTATAAPDMAMLSVDFPGAPANGVSSSVSQSVNNGAWVLEKRSYFDEHNKKVRVKKVLLKGKSQSHRQIIASTFQAVHAISGRATIKSTGEAKRLQIADDNMEPKLLVRTVPRLDHNAYLYAKFAMPKTSSPVIGGQVTLLRDGVYVGTGALPQLAPGEEMELGFGADERVKVKRVVKEDKKGETGTFSTTRVVERSYAIMVKNLHTRDVLLQIIDRIPVPMHQDIKVDFAMTEGPKPTARDVDDKRGTILWQMTAKPDEQKQLAFGYRLTAPGGKLLQFRELNDEQIQANQIMRRR
ncbi:MAG: mucoidy inhibitor MuiA family protein, partial [Alphaproteobacteria bacterium]